MRILVTGANGYLGQGVVRQLLDNGNYVIATDLTTDNIDERAERIAIDLFTVSSPYEYFGKPDVVLHLAWRNGFVHNAISHMEDLPSHYLFLKKLLEGGLKHIAVIGTMHEIGFFEGSINENTPTNPQSLYGIAKNALRNSIELLSKYNGAVYQWIRAYYIVGNCQFGSSIFSKISKAELDGIDKFPFTTGINQWDFIDYDELCMQISFIVEQNEVNGIINACSGRPEKLADRVERFIKDNGYKIQLDYGKYLDRPYDSKAVWGDDSKIRRIMERRNEKSNC